MTRHGFALLALAIIAIASWAYSVNYNTMTRLERLDGMRAQIAKERETLQVLRVEWAYLNAPDRLARLVSEQNTRLGLVPLTPEAMQYVAAIPFAKDDELEEVADAGSEAEAVPTPGFPIPMARPANWRPVQ